MQCDLIYKTDQLAEEKKLDILKNVNFTHFIEHYVLTYFLFYGMVKHILQL